MGLILAARTDSSGLLRYVSSKVTNPSYSRALPFIWLHLKDEEHLASRLRRLVWTLYEIANPGQKITDGEYALKEFDGHGFQSAPSEDLGNLAPPNDVSDGRSSCADEQRPPSRTDSVKTLCYDAEDYESINSFSLPEVQAESRSRGNAGDPFDANDQFDFNPAMISACLFRFIRQHYLFVSVSGGQAIPEGYEPLKPAASIWPSNEPAPGCQHFV